MSTDKQQHLIKELSKFTPLDALNPDNLLDLLQKSKTIKVAKDTGIFKMGQTDKYHVFLLSGAVELNSDKDKPRLIQAGSKEARIALAPAQPRQFNARTKTDAILLQVNRELLDIMLTWDQTGGYDVAEIAEQAVSSRSGDWMTQILQTKAFHRIPPANIQAMFMRLETVKHNPGDVIVKQNQDGDFFYMIKQGRCMVSRKASGKPDPIKLAELGPGDSFGEEALLAESKRNATVTMLSKGTLMRLSKKDFISLLNEPLLNRINYKTAAEKMISGAIWLDVRLPNEYDQGHIESSVNIPLIFLRLKLKQLDSNKIYILYCDTGRRSSAASYILSEKGFETYILKDGINAAVADKELTLTDAN